MRTITLFAVAAACLAISSCTGEEPSPEATAPEETQTPPPEPLSATDKAAIDNLGSDLKKLASALKNASGAKREEIEKRLVAALQKTTDAAALDEIEPLLEDAPRVMMEVRVAGARIRNANSQ